MYSVNRKVPNHDEGDVAMTAFAYVDLASCTCSRMQTLFDVVLYRLRFVRFRCSVVSLRLSINAIGA